MPKKSHSKSKSPKQKSKFTLLEIGIVLLVLEMLIFALYVLYTVSI